MIVACRDRFDSQAAHLRALASGRVTLGELLSLR